MADDTQFGATPGPSAPARGAPTSSPAEADRAVDDPFAERPEVYVGAAFAGGLVLAGLLRLLGR